MNKEANANLIVEFRKANKMSVKEFCEKSNIAISTYYKIIKGSVPKLQTLFGIARTMSISVVDFL